MRKYWLAVLLIGGVLAWGLSSEVPASAEPSAGLSADASADSSVASGLGEGFAKKVAGSYLAAFTFTTPSGEPASSGGALIRIHQDGTVHFATQNMFGRPSPPDSPRSAGVPFTGVWEQSGPRQLKWHLLAFVMEAEAGNTSFVARQEGVVDFSDDFVDVDMTFETSLVFPGAAHRPTGGIFTACLERDCGTAECCDCCLLRDADDNCIVPGVAAGTCTLWCLETPDPFGAECTLTGDTTDEDGNGVEDSLECLLFPPNPDAGSDECPWIGPFAGTGIGKRMHVLD
jgi:hypothetical protein